MAKFNGSLTLGEFKRAAGQVQVFDQPAEDHVWQEALARARTWRRAAAVLPWHHPMQAIVRHEEF